MGRSRLPWKQHLKAKEKARKEAEANAPRFVPTSQTGERRARKSQSA